MGISKQLIKKKCSISNVTKCKIKNIESHSKYWNADIASWETIRKKVKMHVGSQ